MVFAPKEMAESIGWTPKKSSIKRKSKTTSTDQEEKKLKSNSHDADHESISKSTKMQEKSLDPKIPSFKFGPQLPKTIELNESQDMDLNLPAGVTKKVHIVNPFVARYTFAQMDTIIQHVALVGMAKIRCLEGKVNILGFCIDAECENTELLIDSPAWMSALSIEPIFTNVIQVVIEITSLFEDKSSFDVYHAQKVRSVFITEKWNQIASDIINECRKPNFSISDDESKEALRHRILVCGAKGVGKSTYVRYITNRFLSCRGSNITEVAILDCDVGQTELSPPGMLSLTVVKNPILSPAYAHMVGCEGNSGFQVASKHEGACFYGFTTSKTNPETFASAVDHLIKIYYNICKERGESIPLIVNTDGWVKGLGYEILSCIINAVNCGHIIQLIGSTKAKFFDLTTHASNKRHIHVAETSSGSTILSLNPSLSNSRNTSVASFQALEGEAIALRDQSLSENLPHVPSSLIRNLRYCSYFLGGYRQFIDSGAKFQQSGIIDDEYSIANILASKKPYMVPFDVIECHVIDEDGMLTRVNVDDGNVVKNLFNASIVGLCGSSINECYGEGLIRGVDSDRRFFYILTPLNTTLLKENVKSIVRGQLQVPMECIFRGEYSESFPFLCCEGVSVGIGSDNTTKKAI